MASPLCFTHRFLTAVLLGTLLLAAGCTSDLQTSMGPSLSAPLNLTYYTENNPPYNYEENGTLQGLTIDLFELITERMGQRVSREEVKLVPWTEGYQAALTGNNTMIFAIARLPERESSFKWAGPLYPDTTALFARPDSGIVVDSPEDLLGYRIGVIEDDAAVQQLLDLGVDASDLVTETNVSMLVRQLQDGELDLWAYSKTSGRFFTWQVTGNAYSFRIVYTFPDIPIYYGFSRDVPDSTVQAFQQALDDLKAEKDDAGISTYERVLGRHVPAVGLGQLEYLTEEWAPYNFEENGTATGIAVEILEAVFKDIGVNRSREDVRIVPLAEGFREVQNGGSVLFSIVRSPDREPLCTWVGPFTRGSFVVYAPIRRNITIDSPADLNQYRIGVVEDSIENTLLTDRGVNASRIVNAPAPEDLLRMLEEGEIDLWATGDLAGRHQMVKTAEDPNAYEVVFALSTNDFYFVFSKDVPNTTVTAFDQALLNTRLQRDALGVSDYERILYRYLGVGCARQTFADADAMALVNRTAEDIERNAPETFRRINAGQAPYKDPEHPDLYVFVYDENVTMVANADNIRQVGVNYRGKTDVTGKPFRDEIVGGALADGTGWVEYVYSDPSQTGLYYKTTYCRRTAGSDGKTYIVAAGNFRSCE
ncbi:MAG: transporter substrate-binding domain-containing protein [Methanomicrobiales archaeon]|nr:transporter substrate-binding domain-containing protein [Methanomicrobiales archaeon]MDI6877353.1 transporter substrate-binding domain-containing protein [Methanomicrobiales archaeon]